MNNRYTQFFALNFFYCRVVFRNLEKSNFQQFKFNYGRNCDVITIVTINHNCRNRPQLSQHQSQLSQKKTQLLQLQPQLSQSDQPQIFNLTLFFTKLSLFCPLTCHNNIYFKSYNWYSESKSGHFLCKAYCYVIIFAISEAKRNIRKMKFAYTSQGFATEDVTHCRFILYAKKINNNYIRMNKYCYFFVCHSNDFEYFTFVTISISKLQQL